jgi:zinc/manganese transport system permease protein
MILVAIGAGVFSGIAGLVISFHAGTPSGPTIILVAGALYVLSVLVGRVGGILPRLLPRRHLEA